MTVCDAAIRDDGIELAPYDFPGSAFHPRGLCRWDAMREVAPRATPPEVRTADEIVFVPAPLRDALGCAAAERRIPSVARLDVWSLILEPFLDTSFDEAEGERTYRCLAAAGVDRVTCDALREEVGPAMMAYNFDSMLWEWVHLGLYDVLSARRGVLSGARHRLPERAFAAFYHRAMAIALAAPPLEPAPPPA